MEREEKERLKRESKVKGREEEMKKMTKKHEEKR